jgi:hypothetical protein
MHASGERATVTGGVQTARVRVGVALVHGIGEQKRFEHLDGQVRQIVSALKARPHTTVTTEIESGKDGAFYGSADSWSIWCPVRVFVDETNPPRRTLIEFHEVWWADVNEQYSLIKQIRFWAWALSVWVYPGKKESALPQSAAVIPPPTNSAKEAWIRVRLFGVGVIAVVAAASIGFVLFVAERVFKLRAPDFARTFVTYTAGVKLYNQPHRFGPGFPPKPDDFLDPLGEPPRVSVRRRLIRVLLAMAQTRYERWYVFAHSLGSVVAFNGLMETAHTWPGYFDESSWAAAGRPPGPWVGLPRPGWNPRPGDSVPARPVWTSAREIAFRSRIFEHFHGLLTFGCPLEKFAAIWPARVPLSQEPAFRAGTKWFNVFDPTDPVSGILTSFSGVPPQCCPPPQNLGFAAGPLLLLSHLKYLRATKRQDGLSDAAAEWLLSGSSARMGVGKDWFTVGSAKRHRRSALAWTTWFMVLTLLALIGVPGIHYAERAARKELCSFNLGGTDSWFCTARTNQGGAK